MKKLISIIMLVVMTAGTGIVHAAVPQEKVDTDAVARLIGRYEGKEGFEVVSFGNVAMGLVKLLANAAAEDQEEKEALDILDGIHKFVAVEYYGASADRKAAFNREMSELLRNTEKIMEVKDSGDSVDIYGTLSKDGDRINDIIIHVPEDCTFVCFFGNIRTEDLGDIVKMN